MMDAARRRGIAIDVAVLQRELGVPVVETVAVQRDGARALVDRSMRRRRAAPAQPDARAAEWPTTPCTRRCAGCWRWRWRCRAAPPRSTTRSTAGCCIRCSAWWRWRVVMFLIFQAVYAWATPMMDAHRGGHRLARRRWSAAPLPDGPLRSLLVDGVIAGLGGVIVFLPQILILFVFILALEESGYLPRAAFLLDRHDGGGRPVRALASSRCCPASPARFPASWPRARIQDPRDRLATILVAPLMTCSARLPVYALLIGAFIPAKKVRRVQPAGPGAVRPVRGRHPQRAGGGVGDEAVAARQERASAAAGAAVLPHAAPARPGHRPVGARR